LRKSTTMHNLLWEDINQIPFRKQRDIWVWITQIQDKRYYDYGKQETKSGRKMWHVVIGDF
jgi:phosphoribosylaminoimidazole carboxylase (NCAIR synthetase)